MPSKKSSQTGFKRPFKAVPIRLGRKLKEKRRREENWRTFKLAGIAFTASVMVAGGGVWLWPITTGQGQEAIQPLMAAVSSDEQQPRMSLCGEGQRVTCVVDGDTIWLRGEKIRIADIDTPEIGQPQCDAEYQLGMRATYRLRDLLNEGPWSVETIGFRDEDQYGRKLRVLTRGGQSIGDMLVQEGLARTWSGRREPWC
ncbi:thermonuclease family protein [Altererythrobacter sp. GH1-8]|uniref:thermonuclease family protein n=1 Tax=Altererythrobacter sp. GH1-8 TaxID=3349333 RepID=UPI00374DDD90